MSLSGKKSTIRSKANNRQPKHDPGQSRRRRADTPVMIAPGQPDPEALKSVIREWLVPALVRQFLTERGIPSLDSYRSEFANSVYRTPLQGGRGKGRVTDHA